MEEDIITVTMNADEAEAVTKAIEWYTACAPLIGTTNEEELKTLLGFLLRLSPLLAEKARQEGGEA
jgi:hypothetical protein